MVRERTISRQRVGRTLEDKTQPLYAARAIFIRARPGLSGSHPHLSRDSRVSIDEQHVALPKLYGAPPTPGRRRAGPRRSAPSTLTSFRWRQSRPRRSASSRATLPARAYAPGGIALVAERTAETETSTGVTGRSFRIREIAGRVLRI